MKYLLNFIIILSFAQGYSQVKQKIYVDNNEDYVLFLDSSISTQDKSFGSTEVDAFVSVKNKKF